MNGASDGAPVPRPRSMLAPLTVQPLAGAGLATRHGDLLLVCADTGAGVDDLLAAIADVGRAGGDGSLLVRRIAALLANDFESRVAACAASGPTADGRLAVLVYGAATAHIEGADGVVALSGVDAITSVDRLIAGPVRVVRLVLPGAGAANPRTRLDAGVVVAGGLIGTTGPLAAAAATLRPAVISLPRRTPPPAPPPLPMRQPRPDAEFVAVLLTNLDDPLPAAEPATDPRPRVRGVLCQNDHFNDPNLRSCAVCGISMDQLTLVEQDGLRPPLGVLLLDDGSTFRLDLDYLVGREPHLDPEVAGGTVRPLRVADPHGLVSRRHLRVALVGWEVQIIDLGSANGTFLQRPGHDESGEPQRLVAHEPTVVKPGTVVTLGQRWLRYESHRNP